MDIGVILLPGFLCGNIKALLPQKARERYTFEMLSTFNFSLEYNVIFAFKAKIAFLKRAKEVGVNRLGGDCSGPEPGSYPNPRITPAPTR